ncbi:MAG: hypothetical protein GXX84_05735 [Acidobacteria bacterium]|nr:hypothetical protein [Acidobacteriota bacterium]
MAYVIGLIVVACIVIALEYRIRKPDQIVLFEGRDGRLGIRKFRFYPRHFSLPISRTVHSSMLTVEASAKGNLDVRVKISVAVAASLEHLTVLIRVGGWSMSAVGHAAKELEVLLQSYIKEFAEQREIEELSSEKLSHYLNERSHETRTMLGLEIISLAVLSLEPVNAQIADALRQREQARILEHTEKLNQEARIAAAKARLKADEEISALENELELRKNELKMMQFEKETALADARAEHELRLNRMRLEFDAEELRMLKENPELLLLTPQAARLAEASQSLKNARTIVSLGPADAQGSDLLGMFQSVIKDALEGYLVRKK